MEASNLSPSHLALDNGGADPRYSADGVDVTLIRWMLSLTFAERLEVLRQHSQAITRLRDANPQL
jgi:hypothetical protein